MPISQDNRKNPGIKRPYYPLPGDEPDGHRCIEIQIPDGPEYHELLITALKSLTLWYNYARDESRRAKHIADLFRDALGIPELGCEMNCEELTACLQPFLDQIQQTSSETKQALSDLKQKMEAQLTANSARGINVPLSCENALNIYSGCDNLLEKMYQDTDQLYTASEQSLVDNVEEWAGIIVSFIPELGGLPFGAMLELANGHFSTQAADFRDDHTQPMIDDAAFDLYCRITNNNCALTHDVIAQWLDGLPALIPGNATAEVLSHYSLLRITLLNQIAAFLNHDKSLDVYYDELAKAYQFGAQSELALPGGHSCPTGAWSHTIDFTTGLHGFTIPDCNIAQGGGEWVNGAGIRPNHASGGGCDQVIRFSLVKDMTLTAVTLNFASVVTPDMPSHPYRASFSSAAWFQGGIELFNDQHITAPFQTLDWQGNAVASGLSGQLTVDGDIGDVMPLTTILASIDLEGTGTEPTWD